MILDELKISGKISEEHKDILQTMFIVNKDEVKWVTIEVITPSTDLCNGIYKFRDIYSIICEINGSLYSKSILVMDDNVAEKKISVKIFDSEPIINEILLSQN